LNKLSSQSPHHLLTGSTFFIKESGSGPEKNEQFREMPSTDKKKESIKP
jgi:hypothetical protein